MAMGQVDGERVVAVKGVVNDKARSDFSKWLTWGLALGVLPVVANYVVLFFAKGSLNPLVPMSDGELLISSTAIAGAAVGEFFHTTINTDKLRISAHRSGGLAVIFALLCAVSYVAIKMSPRPDPTTIPVSSTLGSLLLFAITVLIAAKCVRLAAEANGV
jgi:hypothetical protein